MHILHTVLDTFPKVLSRWICLTIKACLVGDHFLSSRGLNVWLRPGWYSKRKVDERSTNPPLLRRRADHLWRAQFVYSRSFSALFYSVPLLNLTLLADKHLCSHYLFVCGYNKNVRKNYISITIENWGFIKSVLYFSGWRQNGALSRRSS